MKPKFFVFNQIYFWIVTISFLFATVTYLTPKHSYNWDSFDKMIHSFSILENQFQSENLYYPGKKVDPTYEFFPARGNVFLKQNGRFLSAFPVALAATSAPVLYLFGFPSLPYFTMSFFIFALWILKKKWRIHSYYFWIILLCSFGWILSVEYTEHSLVILLSLMSITFTIRGPITMTRMFFGGLAAGSIVWFRHEGIVYGLSLFLWFFILDFLNKDKNRKAKFIQKYLFTLSFLSGFLLLASSFIAFNSFNYDHPLGPRFITNQPGISVPFEIRLEWAKALLIGAPFKLGYFGYMPAAAILIFVLLPSFNRLSRSNKILLGSTLTYMIGVLLIVPNDGYLNWGPRFFSPAIFPIMILIKRYLSWIRIQTSKRKWIELPVFGICFVYSFLISLLGIQVLREGRNVQRKHNTLYQAANADIWVFPDEPLAHMSGQDYFRKIVFRIREPKEVGTLIEKLTKTWPGKKIAFIHLNKEALDEKVKMHLKSNPEFAAAFATTHWEKEKLEKELSGKLEQLVEKDEGRLEIWTGYLKGKSEFSLKIKPK